MLNSKRLRGIPGSHRLRRSQRLHAPAAMAVEILEARRMFCLLDHTVTWLTPTGAAVPDTTLAIDADADGHIDAGPGDDHASHLAAAAASAANTSIADTSTAHHHRTRPYHPKHVRQAKAARAAAAYDGFTFASARQFRIAAQSSSTLAAASAVAASPLPGMPVLDSNPGSATAIYLDFNGDAGGITAYDEDGDPTTFNAAEQTHITEAVRQIASYFAMFDVTVTTVKPTVPFAWAMIGNNVSGGYSYVGVFPNSSPESFNNSGDARTRLSGLAHEDGHNFGLWHQTDYDLLGRKVGGSDYSNGYDITHGPIMGVDYAQNVHKWFIGHFTNSAATLQDDLKIISNAIKAKESAGGDGFRPDDYAGTIATATAMDVTSSDEQSVAGIIERPTDVDAFSFNADGGLVNIDVAPPTPSGLAPQWEVRDASGNLLYAKDDTDQRNGINNDEASTVDLPAGTYYLMVKSHGDYGDLGQYSAYVHPLPNGWDTQDIGNVKTFTGSAAYDLASDSYQISGSGADIWSTADAFRYAYTTLTGDGSIVAEVTADEQTDPWAKAGVMIRNDLSAGSANAFMGFGAGNGTTTFQVRTAANGTTTSTTTNVGAAPPYWVKIVRAGNVFSAFRSTDGQTWTQQGSSATITMGSTVYVGMAVTSHNLGLINHAAFDQVAITGNTNVQATPNGLTAPTGLTAAPAGTTGSGITLNWTDGAGETGYVIERSVDNAHWTTVTTTAANVVTYTDTPFGSMRYFYRLRAKNASGNSVPSASVAVVNRPSAPSNLTVTSYSQTGLVVNWRDVSGDTGFRVERSTDGTNFTTLATVGTNVPSYYDQSLTVNTQYWYRVTALSAQGDSTTSSVYTTSTRLANPTGLAFTAKAPTHLDLQWSAVAGATGYRIERSTDSTTFTTLIANTGNVTSYSDTTAAALGKYYYRVVGVNALTESSATSSVILAAGPSANPLPTMWTGQDIGSVGGSGATDVTSGTWTVVSGGGTLTGTADAFRYNYVPLNGDGQIIAKVASQDSTLGTGLKAGVMIRESLANNARYAMVDLTPASGIQMQTRSSTGGTTTILATNPATVVAPYWVKLVRSGNTFTGYASTDGVGWTQVSSSTIAMGAAAYVGLADTSSTTTTLATTTFSNLTISDNAPTVATAAGAAPTTVTGTTTALSVLGADDHGEANLTYTWAATSVPVGASSPTFSVNGTNAAKNTVATFSKVGAYTFKVTITDTAGQSVTSTVNVTVSPTVTTVAVSPSTASVAAGGTQQFNATASDQFGNALVAQPTFTWSVTGTGNTIDTTGLLTANATAGNYTVTAQSGTISGTATVTVTAAAPASIAGRYLFYNNSSFDGSDAGANASDDGAIDPGKSALLPGAASAPANLTSYTKGINGVMVDIAGLPAGGSLSATSDFAFSVSTDGTNWSAGPTPATLLIRRGAGANGSDRVELVWPDNTIVHEWLKVVVLADANTGLAASDAFYFGSLVGDADSNGAVAARDINIAKQSVGTIVGITSGTDFDRNGAVTAGDINTAKLNVGTTLAPIAVAGS